MGKTAVEKVFSKKSHTDSYAGDYVVADVDYVMVNDITGPIAVDAFNSIGNAPVRDKIVIIPDHFVPPKDIKSAIQYRKVKDFALNNGIENFFDIGNGGVCHQVMMEKGFAAPGRLIAGADSHTNTYGALSSISVGIGSTEAGVIFATGKMWFKVPETIKININGKLKKGVEGKDVALKVLSITGHDGATYKCMEFSGTAISSLPVNERMTIANMTTEAGAKCSFFDTDDKTIEYLNKRVRGDYEIVKSDADAHYESIINIDADDIEPSVAVPNSPANVKPLSEVRVEIDQAYIGSCTNGRIEDIRKAAEILKGRKINKRVRLMVVPASQEVYNQALREGLIDIIVNAGGYFSGTTCGACLGGYMGVLGPGEVCISSTNRNFIGRMGDKTSKVYLANPSVVAASAILGRIASPEEI
ncbi:MULTISPECIES: 3-isopropylmalate dehydratase large subunit [Acidiplasma]|jgi:3-isopropylmalate/(R)-2-methylmalate dehydratase large subunit|uniref:3-isopropylmalate dehydratase large subunit n=2 Tax=Acidiplasma TaxID=507753 RepID=A0A0Q1B4K4_9ARCH|nr:MULTISPECIES: 3-isopropylmalate dehydratase large subunit [Acidiplasma]KJE48978.1 3-isopropylmalate dehydratase [Acidiplasma sp. MBA-1]KPV46476.1 3-isopropylmalate dehydratase [Acidiplasma aeolicum]KQB34883.1 3-isopropylmalate dehydratase large subunit [Acidiplasma cupricumulans]KQB35544.1 3-isopropylmalate dehydratase large subunit [Acidiplasma aeolicum]WMT54406.1 MAG: 3-isopropylmalate dehydratase large subunit [Acidiplasma sp.]